MVMIVVLIDLCPFMVQCSSWSCSLHHLMVHRSWSSCVHHGPWSWFDSCCILSHDQGVHGRCSWSWLIDVVCCIVLTLSYSHLSMVMIKLVDPVVHSIVMYIVIHWLCSCCQMIFLPSWSCLILGRIWSIVFVVICMVMAVMTLLATIYPHVSNE